MPATYPKGIKNFTTKHDYTDYVMAIDVEDIQDEVVALESILGSNPLAMVNPDPRQPQPWTNISGRFDALDRGITTPVFQTWLNGPTLVNYTLALNGTPLVFPVPLSRNDPLGWYNGSSFTVKRTGWYHLTASLSWRQNASVGTRRMMLLEGSGRRTGSDMYGPVQAPDFSVNTSHIGILTAGTTVGLGVGHSCATKQYVQYAWVSGIFLRDV
jgi:hypothetical protein